MLKDKSRIGYIDIAKGIGIILIVLGHNHINHSIYNWIFSFHVPLFFIVSGYFTKKQPLAKTFGKGAYHILLPYLMVCFIVTLMLFDYSQELHYNSINPFLYRIVPYLHWEVFCMWFLASLFLGKIILSLLLKFNDKICCLLSIFLFCLVLINNHFNIIKEHYFYIVNSLAAQLFLLIGIKIREFGLLNFKYRGQGILMFLILFLGFFFPINMYINSFPLGFLNIIVSTIISISILYFCQKSENNKYFICVQINNCLSYYGRYSLVILCFHSIFHKIIVNSIDAYVNQNLVGFSEVVILALSPLIISYIPFIRDIFNVKRNLLWYR